MAVQSLKRLQHTPDLLAEYNAVILDQLRKRIVEMVSDPSSSCEGRVHYLPTMELSDEIR